MQVFPTTYALEVFANEGGSITLKQEDQYGDDPDIVIVPVGQIPALIRALRAAKAEALS